MNAQRLCILTNMSKMYSPQPHSSLVHGTMSKEELAYHQKGKSSTVQGLIIAGRSLQQEI